MSTVEQKLDRYEKAKAIRAESVDVLEEIGRFVWPSSQDMTGVVNRPEGQVRTQPVYSSTARTSAQRLASGIFSFLMPVGVQWFQFVPQDAEDKDNTDIITWLAIASQAVQSELWRSNFVREMFTTIRSLAVFGTACISVEMDKVTKSIFFKSYHYGDIFYEVNNKGVIDTVFRRIHYTVRQAVMEFGLESLSKKIQDEYKDNKLNEKHEFVHIVAPQDDRKPEALDIKGKKFLGTWIEIDEKLKVGEDGFDSQPYLVGRFDVAPNEIIGRSPSFDLLPEIRMLNDMRLAYIEGSEYAIHPALMVWDDSVLGQPVTAPGGILNLRPDSPEPKPLNTGFNSQLSMESIKEQERTVKDGNFNDLFDALEDLRNMTATEADIRQQSKLVILAPIVNGLQKELFDPLLIRVFDLLRNEPKRKTITDAPKDFDYDVNYQGRLAVAMATLQANATEGFLAKWSGYQEAFPVFDNVNIDDAFRRSGLSSGVPGDLFIKEEERDKIRADRAQRENAAQQAELLESAASAYKDGSVAMQPNSLAEQVMG